MDIKNSVYPSSIGLDNKKLGRGDSPCLPVQLFVNIYADACRPELGTCGFQFLNDDVMPFFAFSISPFHPSGPLLAPKFIFKIKECNFLISMCCFDLSSCKTRCEFNMTIMLCLGLENQKWSLKVCANKSKNYILKPGRIGFSEFD